MLKLQHCTIESMPSLFCSGGFRAQREFQLQVSQQGDTAGGLWYANEIASSL